MNKIAYIHSDGQTGVDRAALDTARKYNIPIVGWCPKNGWAEDMPKAHGIRALFPELKEIPSEDVAQRTRWNARDSHATLIINPKLSEYSSGTSVTEQVAKEMGRPYFEVRNGKNAPEVIAWLKTLGNELTLNIGGPRASECPDAYKKTVKILEAVIEEFQNKRYIVL